MTNNRWPIVLATALLSSCNTSQNRGSNPEREQPQLADEFGVTTGDGVHYLGSSCRFDIVFWATDAPPSVDVTFSASIDMNGDGIGDPDGRAWGALTKAPDGVLTTRSLRATVVGSVPADEIGEGTISLRDETGSWRFSPAGGEISLTILPGKVEGQASGMNDEFDATFAGPVSWTCAAPFDALPPSEGRITPLPDDAGRTPLVVDTEFESAQCQPYAHFGLGP